MLAAGRTLIFMLVGLTVVYLCMFFYLRAGARMRLEEEWAKSGRPGEMGDWVSDREGPAVQRIRIALVIFVYIVPVLGLVTWVWFTN